MNQSFARSLPHDGLLVRDLPVSLFSAVMGLSGLALAWRAAAVPLRVPPVVGEAVGALAVGAFVLVAVAYLAKLARHPQAVRAEFNHPVAGNFFGTSLISLLLLSAVIEPYAAGTARVLWMLGAVASLSLSFVVVSRLLKGAVDRSHAVPAWFIPCVGTLNIPVSVVETAGEMRRMLDFDVDARRTCPTWEEALRTFIGQAERAGILVMCSGIVMNNTHRKLDPEAFRGFALADDLASGPIITQPGTARDRQPGAKVAEDHVNSCCRATAATSPWNNGTCPIRNRSIN